ESFDDLVRRADDGDPTTLPVLREVLKDPRMVDLMGGDLAGRAQRTLIDRFAGKSLRLREALARKLEVLREEVIGPRPAPVERLLAARVVACWLHLHVLELAFAGQGDMAIGVAVYFEKALGHAQKRYLAALKALALVRKLALPVLSPATGAISTP